MDTISLSPYYPDSSVVNSLRPFFSLSEMWTIDFYNLLSQAEDKGEFFELRIMNRLFRIDKVTGGVTEVEM